ncbi:MAG: hypothetical protein IT577_07190 [Verrucomicrobiae bacterium]|nr:hypothetical protein [Verrucomicrobiae bacterium]
MKKTDSHINASPLRAPLAAVAVCVACAAPAAEYTAGTQGVGEAWGPSPGDRVVRISGIYPHLATFNPYGECGIGAVVPWADRLWIITYPPHMTRGGEDRLYTIDKDLRMEVRPESVGGTHANRMIHRESNQLIIGPYFVGADGTVRACDVKKALVGRMTATARHLTDPANRVYFYDMEGAVYEVDVRSLSVNRLFEKPVPGWHGKGGYTSQGRLVIANNGDHPVGKKRYEYLAGAESAHPDERGALAEWDGASWRIIERRQFTEVTGPGGISGSPDDRAPIWAMGWDRRSVILKLLDGGQWHTFRLPMGSFSHDALGGWYTEWPRIREVTEGRLLAHMHGLFYDFPKTFSAGNTGGLRPVATYTRMPVDYCAWQGQIVMTRDDASIMRNEIAGQSNSGIWFGSWEDIGRMGAPAGNGGPWLGDDVAAGETSPPFLVRGFAEGCLHLAHASDAGVEFVIEADADGAGAWRPVARVKVPARGYAFHILGDELKSQWVRVTATQAARSASAYFRLANPPRPATPEAFAPLADIGRAGPVMGGIAKPAMADARKLLFAANLCEGDAVKARTAWTMDGKLEFAAMDDAGKEGVLRTKYGVGEKPPFEVDAASVIVREGEGRFRLPKTDSAYDRPYADGWPRGLREIVTERVHLNAHGSIYEVPYKDAGGLRRMRPICTHGKRIGDFASWRGLLVLTGVRPDAPDDEHVYKTPGGEAAIWFGDVDDLWRMGAPRGTGGPWKDTGVKAGEPSDPYLMAGYRTKSLALSHGSDAPVTFTIEVDFAADGQWSEYRRLTVEPGKTAAHDFPAGYSAHWVRLTADRDTRATATFAYGP